MNMLDTMMSEDLVAIANSNKTVGDTAMKEAGVDNSCSYKATKSGNIIKIAATCGSSSEDSRKLAKSVADSLGRAIVNIYEMDGLQVKTISEGNSEEDITTLKRILYVSLPALTGLALSAFIAFIKLDHVTSKKH